MWEKYQEMMKCVNKAKELTEYAKNVTSLELQGAIYDECLLLMNKYDELAKEFKWVKYITILS